LNQLVFERFQALSKYSQDPDEAEEEGRNRLRLRTFSKSAVMNGLRDIVRKGEHNGGRSLER
jgi:hypothetical protein